MNRLSKTGPRPLLRWTFVRRIDLSDANLERANLSYADCRNAIFHCANFRNAKLEGANLTGADLSDARRFTREQLDGQPLTRPRRCPPIRARQR
ncbi:MAG: pentapeptide repeat-containing protein [Methylocella sp.]